MGKPFFITTAIDYTNGAPHIGHAYEKVLADVLARYHRLKGDDVFFLTGVDQHGQKVQQSAEKAGVAPQQFVDGITAKFLALWKKLGVEYTNPGGWAATTDALHKECVRANLQMLWDDKVPGTDRSRWLYKKTQRGFYSVRQEQFLTDKERGPDGEFGPEWQPVEEREEENFYFRLTEHPDLGFDPKQWLLDFIDKRSADGKPFVVPDFRVAELRNAVDKLEGDLCISRPAARLKWGIPFPESFGAGFVTYVWFDALVNYITYAPGHDPNYSERLSTLNSQPSTFRAYWPPLHVIGKDILIPAHGVYWPIMLKALGFTDEEMPTLLVHGWWNIRGKGGESEKMSKSLGNVVDPDALAEHGIKSSRASLDKELVSAKEDLAKGKKLTLNKEELLKLSDQMLDEIANRCGPEALRYYLMSDITTGRDADFSEERLVQKYNTELANSLGNLLNRTLSMTAKYREGKCTCALVDRNKLRYDEIAVKGFLQMADHPRELPLENFLQVLRAGVGVKWKPRFDDWFAQFSPENALGLVFNLADWANFLVELAAPWKLAKTEKAGDQKAGEELDAVLYHLAESLRIIAILISPVLPKAAHGIFDQLKWKLDEVGKESRFRLADAQWGGLPDGHVLGKPVPLFPRIEAAPASEK